MRSALLALLLTGALVPAPAAAQMRDRERAESPRRGDGMQQRRSARHEQRRSAETEHSTVERESRSERRSERRRAQAERQMSLPGPRRNNDSRVLVEVDHAPVQRSEAPRARAAGDSVREWRSEQRRRPDSPSAIEERNLRHAPGGGLVEQRGPLPPVLDRDRTSRRSVRPDDALPAPVAGTRHAGGPDRGWRTDWRRDRRYDWQDYRRRNRALFQLGFYSDPFGWGYRRFTIGRHLRPVYYHSSYWLRDPWRYRLPASYGRYRWVRYWDDALLVDIYSGQVVDVIYDVFW